jgi:hypothetical protein
MISKQLLLGKIEILPDGQMQIREDTVIAEDGVELARTYRRYVLEPGAALPANTDARVQTVTSVVWTPDVVKAYRADAAARAKAAAAKVQ